MVTKRREWRNYLITKYFIKCLWCCLAFRSGFGGEKPVPIDCAILRFLGTGIKRGHVLKATIGVGPSNL
jgi:hypothetical protein